SRPRVYDSYRGDSMTMSPHSLDEARERAALYALGALPEDEARAFALHLDACATCSAETRAFIATTNDLGCAAPPQLPRPAVRQPLLERIASADVLAQQPNFKKEGFLFVRSKHLPWHEGNAPAIEVKTLFVDRDRGRVTRLVRMPPGSTLHPHRHVDVEES